MKSIGDRGFDYMIKYKRLQRYIPLLRETEPRFKPLTRNYHTADTCGVAHKDNQGRFVGTIRR